MRRLLFGVGVLVLLGAFVAAFAANGGTTTVSPTIGGATGGGIAAFTEPAPASLPDWDPIVDNVSSITAGDVGLFDSTGANPYTGDILITLRMNNPDEMQATYAYLNQMVTVQMLASQVTNESVGALDGSTVQFLLNNAPVAPGTLVVRVDGVVQTEGASDDYTVNYKTGIVTFAAAPALVTADYWYNDPSGGSVYKDASTAAGTAIPETTLAISNAEVLFKVAGDTAGVKYRVRVTGGALYTLSTSGTLSPGYSFPPVEPLG